MASALLIFDHVRRFSCGKPGALFQGPDENIRRSLMPLETALVIAALLVPFTVFAVALWWAETQTRSL
jgi:multisubunit Na+/H+ antiporter MnhC subunit